MIEPVENQPNQGKRDDQIEASSKFVFVSIILIILTLCYYGIAFSYGTK